MSIYESIKSQALKVVMEINDNSLVLQSFGIYFNVDSYILPKIFKEDDLEKKLDNLLIF